MSAVSCTIDRRIFSTSGKFCDAMDVSNFGLNTNGIESSWWYGFATWVGEFVWCCNWFVTIGYGSGCIDDGSGGTDGYKGAGGYGVCVCTIVKPSSSVSDVSDASTTMILSGFFLETLIILENHDDDIFMYLRTVIVDSPLLSETDKTLFYLY